MLDNSQHFSRRLRDAFGCFASGVTVVTLRDDTGAPTGITVNSFSSLSLDPPLVMFSVGCKQVSCRWLLAGDTFNVNVLARDQETVAWQFARPLDDKFAGIGHADGGNGIPLLTGAIAHFECTKWRIMEGGDHVIVVGEVTDFHSTGGDALLFWRGSMRGMPE